MKEYLYDPHTHTAETSKCGHLPAAEVVDRYAGHGFSGLVVTDHLHPEYLSRIDTDHNWDHVIDHYLAGYRASKARGDELGLDVILGAELRFPENDNDYLVYGIPFINVVTIFFQESTLDQLFHPPLVYLGFKRKGIIDFNRKAAWYTHLFTHSRIESIRFVAYIDQIAFCKKIIFRVKKKKLQRAFPRHFLSWIQLSAAAGGKDEYRDFF